MTEADTVQGIPERELPPLSRAPFAALVAFTAVLFLAPQTIFPVLGQLRVALLAIAVAIGSFVLERLVRREPLFAPNADLGLAWLLAAWAALLVPLSYWPGGSASFLFAVFFKSLVVFSLVALVVDSPRRLGLLATWLTLFSVPLALTAISHYANGDFVADSSGVRRITGYDAPLTTNPNDLALTLNLLQPLAVALARLERRAPVKIALFGIAALDACAVVATFSRSGLLTLGVLLAVYLSHTRRRAVWAALGVAAALVAIPLFPSGYLRQMSTIADPGSDPTGSAQSRLGDMFTAGEMVMENPVVGAGAGMNILALNEKRGAKWLEVHNVYLEFATDLGLPGLLLFLGLFWRAFRHASLVRRSTESRELAVLADGIRASLIAFAVAACFHPAAYAFYFWFVAGLSLAVHSMWEHLHADSALQIA
ncbi:MAG TPA: O-antigen ligase family protein [bacterium]|nr:O-antigen ligase family protein [bacterium]